MLFNRRYLLWLATALGLLACSLSTAWAHPVPLAHATITIEADGGYRLNLACDVAACIMQAQPGHLEGALADEFRTLPVDDLKAMTGDVHRSFSKGLIVAFDGQVARPTTIELPDPAALQADFNGGLPGAPPVIRAQGRVPRGASHFTVRFPADVGPVALRVVRENGEPLNQLVAEGETSEPVPLAIEADRAGGWSSHLAIGRQYLALGFEHILPFGLDHILFVLGLFLLSPHLKPLLWQVTAFTVAHSISLALSSCHVISMPAAVVEPLIALSIALVALENLFTSQLKPWRPVVVFGFGLVHGLGFAEVLHETQLAQHDFLTALLAFNVGVELGQLAVIGLAFLAVGWFRDRAWYRPRLAVPASCCIGLAGLYWMAERIWF